MTPEERVEVLRAACCVAGADGKVGEQEKALVDKLAKDVGVGRASVDAMVERSEKDQDFYERQFAVLKADPREAMAVLLQVAMADGKITDGEVRVLRGLAGNLNVPEDVFEQVLAQTLQMASD